MKKITKALSLLLVFAVLASTTGLFANASDSKNYYYIDAIDGDDANSGTDINNAVKSIAGLKDLRIGPGTHFLFRNGGEYECAVTLTCEGTKDNPVVISSYGEGETAVLYTNEKKEVFQLFDCSYVTISDLNITAPKGGGIWIDTYSKTSVGITIDNVYFYGMPNGKVHSRDDFQNGASGARAAVMVKGLPAKSRYAVNDLAITNCEVYDCANGFIVWGSWNESQTPWCEEEDIDPIFNTGLLIEGCYFHEMDAEAVVIGMCDGALVTHCRSINCCQGEGVDENGEIEYFTAAMWFWGSVNSTIQYCEIAGQKNFGDGMAVDFDSFSHNCTYQYIYSHDNMRFMCNCPNHSGQHGNTVRYCLSVNDNGGRSTTAGGAGEYGFSFYNNTIINCGEFQIVNLYESLFANNIIIPADGFTIAYDLDPTRGNTVTNNCYYGVMTPLIDLGSFNTVPGFAGEGFEGLEQYFLSDKSPLIGAGLKIEDDECTTDFFGNEITSTNIGCYGGEGVDAPYEKESFIEKLIRTILDIIETIKHEIFVIFD